MGDKEIKQNENINMKEYLRLKNIEENDKSDEMIDEIYEELLNETVEEKDENVR